jgi:hypothetical protein
MYCPNCGASNSTEQNFCRACGMQLGEISTALLAQASATSNDKLARSSQTIERVGKIGLYGLGGICTVATASVAFLIVYRAIVYGGNAFALFVPLFWIFGTISILYLMYKRSRRRRGRLSEFTQPVSVVADELFTARLCDGKSEPGSIAEVTTRHLK